MGNDQLIEEGSFADLKVGATAMTFLKLLGVCVLCWGLTLPAYADRGSAAYKKGVRAERQGNLDAAYGFYNQAHALSPRNARYFMAYTEMRFKAANEHVHNGQLLRNTGELEQALTEFQQAVGIDASSFIAHQELRLTEDLLRQREEQRAGPLIQPPLANLEPAEPLELQPISSRSHYLQDDRGHGHGLQGARQNGRTQRALRCRFQAPTNQDRSGEGDCAAGAQHGGHAVEDFLAAHRGQHDFCHRGRGRKTQGPGAGLHEDVLPAKRFQRE